ncbi:MAG: glutamate racemase [Clostridia bacterium]|nr:glutamate racemase [Clostridia bacterium]
MNNKAIGVFDSGLGGLTAVKEIMEIMPNESVVYFGDTGRVPYGSRSEETIIKYTKQDIAFLKQHDIKLVLAACGTASSVALPYIKECGIKTIGVVEPTVKKALSVTKNGRVGIIGTAGTIKSKSYENMLLEASKDVTVTAKACPLFVPLVENGYLNCEVTRLVASEYLEEIIKSECDTLILGCTHYPLLKDAINEITQGKIKLIDAGKAAADYVKEYLKENSAESNSQAEYSYYVSDEGADFVKIAEMFLSRKIDKINSIDIESVKVD